MSVMDIIGKNHLIVISLIHQRKTEKIASFYKISNQNDEINSYKNLLT
jgi:hypothetical protein